jgi:hypothetical protein
MDLSVGIFLPLRERIERVTLAAGSQRHPASEKKNTRKAVQ